MTAYIVSSGQTLSGVTLAAGDTVTVLVGGTTISTIVTSGAFENVSGGVASGTVIQSGGQQILDEGSVSTRTVINAGGIERVGEFASAVSAFVMSGGHPDDRRGDHGRHDGLRRRRGTGAVLRHGKQYSAGERSRGRR